MKGSAVSFTTCTWEDWTRRSSPGVFKRAIPFRMNIRLEDFVKEYICMEQDIEIQDMQESVMRYGQMRSKIEATLKEIQSLTKIRRKFLFVRR